VAELVERAAARRARLLLEMAAAGDGRRRWSFSGAAFIVKAWPGRAMKAEPVESCCSKRASW
jgi:hypothetical protein